MKNIYKFIRRILSQYYYNLKVDSYKLLAHFRDIVDIFSFIYSRFGYACKPEKVLGIVNFNDQLFGLGDAIIFQENLCVLKEESNVNKIDICIVDDKNHLRNKIPSYDWTTQWNHKKYMILQTNFLNPWIGNIFYFDNYEDFNHFRISNRKIYNHYPNRRDQFPSDYRPIRRYYENNKKIPLLSADTESLKWAERIIEQYVKPSKLIIIQIRNMGTAKIRNTDIDEWGKFIMSLDKRNYKIICICLEDELIDSWREIEGLYFSKDLGADFLKDCALIQLSHLSLFPPSAMVGFALCSGSPYLLFASSAIGYWRKKSSVKYQLNGDLEDFGQYVFQTQFQKTVWEKESYEVIKRHFDEIVGDLDRISFPNNKNQLLFSG